MSRAEAAAALHYLIKMRPGSMTRNGCTVYGFGGREVYIGSGHHMFRRFEITVIKEKAQGLSILDMAGIEKAARNVCKFNSNSVNSVKYEHTCTS